MPSQRRSSYIFAMSGVGAVQPDFDTPMPDSALNTAWSITSDTLPAVEEELTRVLDCQQQDLIAIELQRRITRWTADFEADPNMLAPAVAYLAGVAGAPVGTPRNQIFTVAITDATGGTFKLLLPVGTRTKETTPIVFNPVAADIKRALEGLTAIGRNNTTVTATGTPGEFTVEILGNLARADMGALDVDDSGLTGVGAAVAVTETQTPIQRAHAISRIAGFQPPAWGAIIGSKTSNRALRKWNSLVADSLRVGGGRNAPRITASLGVGGSAEPAYAGGGFALPACQLYRAARFLDCDLIIDGVSYAANNLWRSFELRATNGLILDEDAQTDQDEDVHRAERADQRPFVLDANILGERGDDIHSAAETHAELPVSLRIGRSGANVTFTLPKAVLSLRSPDLAFDGTARRSAIALTMEALLNPGDASSPWTAVANVGQAATLLTPAV